jgi:hypothetical protein
LDVISRDLSQAEKETIVCHAKQIHKMTAIFTLNGPRLSFGVKNSCHFVNFRLNDILARMTLWPETLWPGHFGQNDTLAKVTIWPETLWPE